jgi:repressor LexA
MNLTNRQKEILDFIRSYRVEHGISPTQREIREAFKLSSFGTVQKHLKRLEEKGALAREWNRSRGSHPRKTAPVSRGVPLLDGRRGPAVEPFPQEESIEVPSWLLERRSFSLRVRGESMIEDGSSTETSWWSDGKAEAPDRGRARAGEATSSGTTRKATELAPARQRRHETLTPEARDVTIQGSSRA